MSVPTEQNNFVKCALTEAEITRLRTCRYEKEWVSLEFIAEKVVGKFNVPVDKLRQRCRGGISSDARKLFDYSAVILLILKRLFPNSSIKTILLFYKKLSLKNPNEGIVYVS